MGFLSRWCGQSAPSNPPATLPEEINHCQYLLTSECVLAHPSPNPPTHTYIRNTLIVRTVTLKCTHTRSNLNSHTTQPPPPPPSLRAHACRFTKMHTHTHTSTDTHAHTQPTLTPPVFSIQGVLHSLSVYDTHTPGGLWQQKGLYD